MKNHIVVAQHLERSYAEPMDSNAHKDIKEKQKRSMKPRLNQIDYESHEGASKHALNKGSIIYGYYTLYA